jgi:cell wall-associated NlpC family hydrolase
VVLASGGFVFSSLGASAYTAPGGSDYAAEGATSDLGSLSAQAQAALAPRAVTVLAGTQVDVEVASSIAVTPAPEPEPEPEPVAPVVAPAAPRASGGFTTENLPPPPGAVGNPIYELAARYIGTPYVHGGATPAGFDCSGFVSYVYAQFGVSLPRSSGAYPKSANLTPVAESDARIGDIIWSPGHVSIYLGDGLQIEGTRPGDIVRVSRILQSNTTYLRIV